MLYNTGGMIMTMNELRTFLAEHNVPRKLYSIGKRGNGRICIDRGENGWEVYFCEKKEKIGTLLFADEESACQGMKNEMRKLMEQLYGLTWAAAV